MLKKTALIAALALGSMSLSVPATAQLTQQGGLVNVTITDVSILNNFLNDTQIAALNNLNVPITVQAPIGIAANVCNLSVAVLGAAGSGGACEAKSGSRALAQLVNRQMLSQKK
jgi:hypothetical protein